MYINSENFTVYKAKVILYMVNDFGADRVGVVVKNKKDISKNSAVVSILLIAEMITYYNSVELSTKR